MGTFGSSSRIRSHQGANAAWKISTQQSKRSSSSRFSAASLRGLIGHQTAPARVIPNTQANAIGSFADRIATLSPGRTPAAASAGRDPVRQLLHLGVGERLAVGGQAGRVRTERGALVEVVDQPHCYSVTAARSADRLGDQPEAAQYAEQFAVPERLAAEAKPTRFGGCCSSEYAAYACSRPVCL